MLSAIVALSAADAVFAEEPVTRAGSVIDKDTVWEGKVQVDRSLSVAKGAVLTVKPGTSVLFGKGAGLVVEGLLVAEGSVARPVRFSSGETPPAPGDWTGIAFIESGGGSALTRCVVSFAESITVVGSSPKIRDCEIEKGRTGLALHQKAGPIVSGNVIREMSKGGINCGLGSSPVLTGNTIKSCGPYGVLSSQNAAPFIRNNVISECERGVAFSGAIPPVEGNLFRKNKVGLGASSAGRDQIVRGNRFLENETGILCENFSDPVIERNEFTGNGDALACLRSSSPWIRNNEISNNRQGISCSRLCRPKVVANNIYKNRKGIFLTLSSYAVVSGNNIYSNEIQMELGDMSSDWEKNVGKKPERGIQAQYAVRMNRGIAGRREPGQDKGDGAVYTGFVDATGNWWGEKDTEEMERKGPRADIGSLVDSYDLPTRTYEGYQGEYAQDRIKYEGWKKDRIREAGIP